MKKWAVRTVATISIHTIVEAETEAEAKDLAMDRGMQSFCNQCSDGNPAEEWTTSGELDGEPQEERIEVVEVQS